MDVLRFTFLVLTLTLCAWALPLELENDSEWNTWKQKHGKIYESELEEIHRHAIWIRNKKYVEEHNHYADKFGYQLTINKFSDLESFEMTHKYKGLKMSEIEPSNSTKYFKFDSFLKRDVAQSIDWRDKGAVTHVKNQGQCGSCWAFGAIGSLEGQHFLNSGELVSLSEQNLVDCSTANDGCNGGFPYKAFEYIRDNGGVDTENSYPYTARDGSCMFASSSVGATCTGYVKIPPSDEMALMQAVATVGPVTVSIDASHTSFQQYSSGVYYEPSCYKTILDHVVLVVGYGTSNGQDYWLVKNSWGDDWGLDGYIKMARNMNNNCGIATSAVYPTV